MRSIAFLGLVLLQISGALASDTDLKVSDGRTAISLQDIRRELQAVPKERRNEMTSSKVKLEQFITNILVERRIAEAAEAAGYAASPTAKIQLERARRDIVGKLYLTDKFAELSKDMPDFQQTAKERYELNKSKYTQPEAIRVAHILFRVDPENPKLSEEVARAKAEEALTALKGGAAFSEVAEKTEELGSRQFGGEIKKWIAKGELVPPFEEAAWNLKPGEISGIVRTRYGFHIVKLLEVRPASTQSFDEVKASLLQQVKAEFLKSRQTDFMQSFSGKQDIYLNDEVLQALQ